MPVSSTAMMELIVQEVGDANTIATTYLDAIWDSYADKALVAPRLQELYAKRRVIDLVRAQLRNQVDVAGMGTELQAKKSQRIATLVQMRVEVQSEIARIERRLMATRFATATITAVTPEVPPCSPQGVPLPPWLDANSPVLRGDPYYDNAGGVLYDGANRVIP